jgi:hypothetical protein
MANTDAKAVVRMATFLMIAWNTKSEATTRRDVEVFASSAIVTIGAIEDGLEGISWFDTNMLFEWFES